MKKLKKPLLVGMSLLTAAIAIGCRGDEEIEDIYGPPNSYNDEEMEAIYGPPSAFGMEDEEIEDIYGPPSYFNPELEEEVEEELSGNEAEEELPVEDGTQEERTGEDVIDETGIEIKADGFQQLIYGPPEMMGKDE